MARKVTPTVRQSGIEYAAHLARQRRAPSHVKGCRNLVFRLADVSGNVKVGSLTRAHVEGWFDSQRGVAPATWNQYRYLIRGWLLFVQARGWLSHAPSLMESIPAMRVPKRARKQLTHPELARLMEAADDPRDKALVAFVATMGVRISEALALKVSAVNLDRSEVSLIISKGYDEDVMPLWRETEDALREWLTHYATRGLHPDAYLFPARDVRFANGGESVVMSYKPDSRISEPQGVLTRVMKRAGLEGISAGDNWHMLRRSAARIVFDQAVEQGHDKAIRIASAFLHHANAATTERYLGLTAEKKQRDAIIRGSAFFPNAGNVVPLSVREG